MPEPQTPQSASPTSELNGKGFFSNLGEHKVMLIGAIVGILFVVYIIAKGRSNATSGSTANSPVDQTGTQQGSLGNSGYQDSGVAYGLTQLGQQLNNLTAQMGQMPTTNPNPTPNPGSGYTQLPGGPLLAPGSYTGPSYSNLKPGTRWTYQGVTYNLFTGGGGRLYGKTPTGTSVLLTEPTSAYPQPPLLNPLANHSPIVNYMSLTPLADHGYDLSNVHVAARSGLAISNHPGLMLQIRS